MSTWPTATEMTGYIAGVLLAYGVVRGWRLVKALIWGAVR